MMRRIAFIGVLALLAGLVAAAPAAAASCQVPRGAHVVVRSSEAVIFSRGIFRTYGCHRSKGRRFQLTDEGGGINGESKGSTDTTKPQLAGRYVGYVTLGSAIGDEFDRMYVFDLVLGRPKWVAGSNFIRRFVLKRNSSVAWVQGSIVAEPDPDDPRVYEIRKISQEERQGVVLVDRGAGIDPASLTLAPDRLSILWRHENTERTASLR